MKKGRKIAIAVLLSGAISLSLTVPASADSNPYYYNGNAQNYNTTAYYPTTYTNTGTVQTNNYNTTGAPSNYNQYSQNQTYNNGQTYNNYNQGGMPSNYNQYGNSTGYNQYNPNQTYNNGQTYNSYNQYGANPEQVKYPNSYPTYGNSTSYNQYAPNQTYNNGQTYNNYNQNGSVSYSTYNMPTKANPIQSGQKLPLYQNQSTADLNNMINQIGDRMREKSKITTKVTFKLNNDAVKNATTNFNGTITVYRGLIEYCEDGDELAFVIGHELGHATKNHIIKGYVADTGINTATEVLKSQVYSRIGNYWGRLAASTATDMAGEAASNKYSRVLEKDADLLAIDYTVAAGYNPLAGISIMNKIGENYADFWYDHPSTDKRIITMYNYIKEKYPKFLESGYDSYSYKQAVANYLK